MGTYYHTLTTRPLPKLPGRIISLDCEPVVRPDLSAGWCALHTLKAGALVCTDYVQGVPRRWREVAFTSQRDCWLQVERWLLAKRITWIIAHGLAYDWTLAGGWKWVDGGNARLDSYVIDDPPTTLLLAAGGKLVRVVDLLNYWRKPLAVVAGALGLDYLDSAPLTDDVDRAAAVALNHARIVDHAAGGMVTMLAEAMGGGWAGTAAGISWACWRSKRWGSRVRVHNDKDATRLERLAYVGGRVESYRRGPVQGPLYALDVNNLYGSVMVGRPYPVKLDRVGYFPPATLKRLLADGVPIVAAIRARVDASLVPCRAGTRTWYPPGTFDCTLAGPDIAAILEHGSVETVYQAALYKPGDPFGNWVPFWYTWRLTRRAIEDRAGAALCKLITSTLFGRFGMTGRTWQAYPGAPPPGRYLVWHERDPDTDDWVRCRSVAGCAQRQAIGGEGQHAAVAIAAYVTAYARQRMNELRLIAGPDTVCYEDTDCLHVTAAGRDRLANAGTIHADRLGALKCAATIASAFYHGPKSYRLDGEIHASGLSADAIEVSDGTWLQDRHRGLRRVPSEGPTDHVLVESVPFTLG